MEGGNERHSVCFTGTENIMTFVKVGWSDRNTYM
jgi:hypothetical protein